MDEQDFDNCLTRSKYFGFKISSPKAFHATASFFVKYVLRKLPMLSKMLMRMILQRMLEMLEVCRLFVRSNKHYIPCKI